MSLTERFKDFIKEHDLFHPKDRLLIAVSGGVDSVVLCALCDGAGYTFAMAHCNFQLRGKESEEDAAFVKALSEKYQVPYFEKQFDTGSFAAENKLTIQVAARRLRYDWFQNLLNEPFFGMNSYILTAHHADDNIETVLMNFFKGSGMQGLKGILPKNGKLVRPVLFAKKEEILSYAHENKLPFREDSSNSEDKYTRNYFRNELIPAVEKVFPSVKDNLAANIEKFREINILYRQAVDGTIKNLLVNKDGDVHISVLKLLKTPASRTIIFEIIKQYGFNVSQADEVIKLLHSGSGKYILSATHRILHNRKWLIISRLEKNTDTLIIIEEGDTEIGFPQGQLHFSSHEPPFKIEHDRYQAQLDMSTITFPLILRKWKQGDYFYPLGMEKKKKLSRYFIDQKYSIRQKEQAWLVESDKRILWIIGERIDNRFRLKPGTTGSVKIHWLPSK